MKEAPYDADLVALQAIMKANMDQRSKAARDIKRYTEAALDDPVEATREALASEAGHCQWIEDRIMVLLSRTSEKSEIKAWLVVLAQYQKRRADALTKLERITRKPEGITSKAQEAAEEAAESFYGGDHA